MRELVIANGFVMVHSCGCDGLTETYRNESYPGVKIKLKIKKGKFQIFENDRIVKDGVQQNFNPIFTAYLNEKKG
jgi:hypothetical protein